MGASRNRTRHARPIATGTATSAAANATTNAKVIVSASDNSVSFSWRPYWPPAYKTSDRPPIASTRCVPLQGSYLLPPGLTYRFADRQVAAVGAQALDPGSRATGGCAGAPIEPVDGCDEPVEREPVLDMPATALAVLPPALRVAEVAGDGPRHPLVVVDGGDAAGLAVSDRARHAADPGGDYRHAGRLGLDQRDRRPLVVRGLGHDVAREVHVGHVAAKARPDHARAQRTRLVGRAELLPQLAVADDQEHDVGIVLKPLGHAQEAVHALDRDQ